MRICRMLLLVCSCSSLAHGLESFALRSETSPPDIPLSVLPGEVINLDLKAANEDILAAIACKIISSAPDVFSVVDLHRDEDWRYSPSYTVGPIQPAGTYQFYAATVPLHEKLPGEYLVATLSILVSYDTTPGVYSLSVNSPKFVDTLLAPTFARDVDSGIPVVVAVAPEPSVVGLFLLGLGLNLVPRARSHSCFNSLC